MSGGGTTTTQTQRLDDSSQRYVNQTRNLALKGANSLMNLEGSLFGPETMSIYDQAKPFLNPWMEQVINPVNAQFDRALDQSRIQHGDAARRAGAFGSARHGVAEAVGMGEIERARGGVLGGLYNSGWQQALGQGLQYQAQQRQAERQGMMEPFLRSQMALNLRNQGLGPTGSVSTTREKQDSNVWGQVAGLGLGIAGNMLMPGMGSLLGAGIPLLGGGSASYGQMAPQAPSFPSFSPGITSPAFSPPPAIAPPAYSQPNKGLYGGW